MFSYLMNIMQPTVLEVSYLQAYQKYFKWYLIYIYTFLILMLYDDGSFYHLFSKIINHIYKCLSILKKKISKEVHFTLKQILKFIWGSLVYSGRTILIFEL